MAKKKGFAWTLKVSLICLASIILLLAGGGYFYYYRMLHNPQPRIDGDMQVIGLRGKVEIIRDAYGIPHLYARNLHDLFFAQGYVQAQDRWWQMEFFRHTCGGRIEELTGKKEKLVAIDIYMRTLGIYQVAQLEYDSYSQDQRDILDAFAKGVNAHISGKSPKQLSVNYTILGLSGVQFNIKPWSPLDTLAFAKLMAWDLGLSRDLELTRSKLYNRLGAKMAEQWLVPQWPHGQKPTIMLSEDVQTLIKNFPVRKPAAPGGSAFGGRPGTSQIFDQSMPELSGIIGGQPGVGSNSWVATGSLTQNGKALLANDPHLGIQMPSIWYELALHCGDDGQGRPFDVAGFTFATLPGVVVGHNNDIAWGTTNVYPDVNDLYMIKVNPDNPLQYAWNGKWRNMNLRHEVIHFGDGNLPLKIEVRETHLGPIVNDNKVDSGSGQVKGFNSKEPLALRWTALEPSNLAKAISGLNKARNWEEFIDAARYWDVPSQSIVYADRHGNIGYIMPGKIPIRPFDNTGQVPTPGWSSDHEWRGYIPYEMLPRIYNPQRGYIVASNQEVATPEYYDFIKQRIGMDTNPNFGSKFNKWNYGYRGQRISSLIKELAPLNAASCRVIQTDNRFLPADDMLPYLAGLRFSDPEIASARDWLMQWNRVCSEDSPQAALYNEFWIRLMKNVFQNKLGDIAKSDGLDREMRAIAILLQTPNDQWWDDPATAVVERRDDMLARSFNEGYAAAVAALGKDRSQWRWGKLHSAKFVSNPLGASGIGLIEAIVNRSKVPVGGNSECVNSNIWYAGNNDFALRSIPSMRLIVDMGDLTKCLAVNSTGQSGHPGNQYYGDMIDAWRSGKYHPLLWSRRQVETGAAHRLNLKP